MYVRIVLTVLSMLPEAKIEPSGDHAIDKTQLLCPAQHVFSKVHVCVRKHMNQREQKKTKAW